MITVNRSNSRIMFALLRCAICGNQLDEKEKSLLCSDAFLDLYKTAKAHDIAHLLARGLDLNGMLGSGDTAYMSNEISKALFRYERMSYAYKKLCDALEDAHISFVPLKGSVLRDYYPEPWMRTSCDIDVLVRQTELEAAVDALVACGFRLGQRNYHDVSLFFSNDIHLELHFSIKESNEKLDGILENAWDYALPAEGGRQEFSPDFFVFYFFAHACYHFLDGGCGVRTLMDIYIMQHKMGCTCEIAADLLQNAGIYKFAVELSRLSEACFSTSQDDLFGDKLLKFIVNGGAYGNEKNKVTVAKTQSSNTAKYAIKRLFLPLGVMKGDYPVLEKWPILLPFCWIARWFKTLFGGKTRRVMRELRTASGVSADKMKDIEEIYSRLEL